MGEHVVDIFCCAYLATGMRKRAYVKALRVAAWNVLGHFFEFIFLWKDRIAVELENRCDIVD
jgi:hypothetical protein